MVTAAQNTVMKLAASANAARDQHAAAVVPVAFLGRTSTLELQDPRASLHRQARSVQAWLPPGFRIVAWYWDIESGGLDLEDRSQTDSWRKVDGIGIPRDGGMADLLTEAAGDRPRFAAVACEDINRSARDTFNALKLEKDLAAGGITLFAANEPLVVEGANATTILLRRTKQAIAEFFRIQIKEDCWKGLIEHTMDGWNIGPAPYGYRADRVPHPAPAKAAQGRTKTRLIPDPVRGRSRDPDLHLARHPAAVRADHRVAAEPGPGRLPAARGRPRLDRDQRGRHLAEPQVHRAHGLRPDP